MSDESSLFFKTDTYGATPYEGPTSVMDHDMKMQMSMQKTNTGFLEERIQHHENFATQSPEKVEHGTVVPLSDNSMPKPLEVSFFP